jgi:hypothetical protein
MEKYVDRPDVFGGGYQVNNLDQHVRQNFYEYFPLGLTMVLGLTQIGMQPT